MIKENTPLIETERLILRKFTQNDVDDILLIYGDKQVNKFLPWFPIKTRADAKEYLCTSILPDYKKDVALRYAIALKSDNRAIGYVNVSDIGKSNDLGYGLLKEFWNKSIATEAAKAVVIRAREVGLKYITATHDINNPYSGDVMKKLGMNYRYSYEQQWMPKDILVTFRMYQLDFDDAQRTYTQYQEKYHHFIEQIK